MLCRRLSAASAGTNLLDQYGPELIQLLVNREPPATICQQIGICSRKMAAVTEAEVRLVLRDFYCVAGILTRCF